MKAFTPAPLAMLIAALAAVPVTAQGEWSPARLVTANFVIAVVPAKTPINPPLPVLPQPNDLIPALPGTMVVPLPGGITRPLPHQIVRTLPGQMIRLLPGQRVRALPGQIVPPLPGQIVR